MEVRLIDRARNVTRVPGPPYVAAMRDKPFDTLDWLLEGQNTAEGQHEFRADGEFMTALDGAPEDAALTKPDTPWDAGHEATYRGVPIIVERGEPA